MAIIDGRTTSSRKAARSLLESAHHIVILYSSVDLRAVRGLRRRILRLRRSNTEVNVFLAAESLAPATDVSPEVIAREIARADLVVVVCGALTHASQFVRAEVEQALLQRRHGQTQILPIILKNGVRLPEGLDFTVQAIHQDVLFPSIRIVRAAILLLIVVLSTAAIVSFNAWKSSAHETRLRRILEAASSAMRDGKPDSAQLLVADAFDLDADLARRDMYLTYAATVNLERTFRSEKGVASAVVSSDRRRMITTGDDVKLWDAEAGVQLANFMVADNAIQEGSFSPDSKHVVTTGPHLRARLWSAASGALIGPLGEVGGTPNSTPTARCS